MSDAGHEVREDFLQLCFVGVSMRTGYSGPAAAPGISENAIPSTHFCTLVSSAKMHSPCSRQKMTC